MPPSRAPFARQLRLSRLHRYPDNRLLVVPLDHTITDGPLVRGAARLDQLVGELADNGADAVILHKGSLRQVDPKRFRRLSLIVHLSASTSRAPDPHAKVLVAGVEEALRLGADGVSVHMNVGSSSEARQMGDLGSVSEACDRWNIPLLAMMYPRGPKIAGPPTAELLAHAATVAVELGADIVKLPYAGSVEEMTDVTMACPIPVLVAGGERKADEASLKAFVNDSLRSGAVGVAMGRTVFQASSPGATVKLLADLIHATTAEPGCLGLATSSESEWV